MGVDKLFLYVVSFVSSYPFEYFFFFEGCLVLGGKRKYYGFSPYFLLGILTLLFLGAYLFILSSLALFTYLWVKFFSTSFVSLSVIFFCLPLLELGLEWVVAALGETTLPFLPLLGAKLLSIPLNIFLFYWWQKRETRRGLEYVE